MSHQIERISFEGSNMIIRSNGRKYLVRTDLDCPQSEGAPEAFSLNDVTIVGLVTVTNGSVNQFLLMQDNAASDLHVKMPHPHGASGSFSDYGKDLGQNILKDLIGSMF